MTETSWTPSGAGLLPAKIEQLLRRQAWHEELNNKSRHLQEPRDAGVARPARFRTGI